MTGQEAIRVHRDNSTNWWTATCRCGWTRSGFLWGRDAWFCAGIHTTDTHPTVNKEGAPMRTITQIEDELASARVRVLYLKRELEKAKALPAEPLEGSVIRFEVQFTGSARIYTYVGVRIGARWYLTGNRENRKMRWVEVVHLIRQSPVGKRPYFTVLADKDQADVECERA